MNKITFEVRNGVTYCLLNGVVIGQANKAELGMTEEEVLELIEGNPDMAPTEVLEKIKIGDTVFSVDGGSDVYVVKDLDCQYKGSHHYDNYNDYLFTISDSLLTAIQENKNLCVGKVTVGSSSSKLSELLFWGTALANAHEAILTLDYHNDDGRFFNYSTFVNDGSLGINSAIVSFEVSVTSRTPTTDIYFVVQNVRVQEGLEPVVTDGNLVLAETPSVDYIVQFNVTEKLPMNQSIYNLTFVDTANVISSLPQDKPVVFVMQNEYDMMFVIDDNLENKILSFAGETISLPFLTIENFENYHVSDTNGGAKVYSFTVTPSGIAQAGNLNGITPLRILNGKHSTSGSFSSTTYVFKTPSITRYDENGDPVQEDLGAVDYAITFSKATFDRFIAELPNDVNFPVGMPVPRNADEVLTFLNSAFQENSLSEQNVAWLMMMILINNSDNATAKFEIPGGELISKLPQKLEANTTTLFFSGVQSFNTGSGISAFSSYCQMVPDAQTRYAYGLSATWSLDKISGDGGGDSPSVSSVKKYRLYFRQNNTVTLNRGGEGDPDFDEKVYRLFGFEFEGEDIANKFNDFITLINSQYSTSFPSISSETDIPQSLKTIIATLIAGGIDSSALHLGLCLLVQIISRKPDTTVEQLTTNGVMDPSSFYSVHMFGTTGGYFDTETIFEYYTYYGGWQTGYYGMYPTPTPSDSITSLSTSSNQGSAIHTLPLPLSLVDDYDVVFEEMSSGGSGGGSSLSEPIVSIIATGIDIRTQDSDPEEIGNFQMYCTKERWNGLVALAQSKYQLELTYDNLETVLKQQPDLFPEIVAYLLMDNFNNKVLPQSFLSRFTGVIQINSVLSGGIVGHSEEGYDGVFGEYDNTYIPSMDRSSVPYVLNTSTIVAKEINVNNVGGNSGGTSESPYDYIQIVLPNSNHLIFMADKKFTRESSTIASVNQLIETLNQMGSLEIPSITKLEDLSQTVDYLNNLDTSTYAQIKVVFWASVFQLFPYISLSVKGYVNGEIVPVNVAGIADTGTSTFAYSIKYIDSTCAWNTIASEQTVFDFQLFINNLD